MVKVGDTVRIKETTVYDAPSSTTENPEWDGTYFGGRSGEVFQLLHGDVATVARVDLEGVEPGITGRGWIFPLSELEVI